MGFLHHQVNPFFKGELPLDQRLVIYPSKASQSQLIVKSVLQVLLNKMCRISFNQWYLKFINNLLKYPTRKEVGWYFFKILSCIILQCKIIMTNQGVLNEDFPMRTFTVLLITLNYVRYRSPTLVKKKSLFRELSFRIRNYPVGA